MRGTSPILVTAALSLAGLIVAIGMQLGGLSGRDTSLVSAETLVPAEPRTYMEIEDADGNGTPDWQDELLRSGVAIATSTEDPSRPADPIENFDTYVAGALYGGYLSMKQEGGYSHERGDTLARNIASNIRAPKTFVPHTVDDIRISEDVSSEHILAYREALGEALRPMDTEDPPEFELFAYYLETHDRAWLEKVAEAATRYRAAEANMIAVAVPKDAAPEHLRVLNSIGEYADTLERLARYGSDTFASVALLKTMNENEEELIRSFDLLAEYYVRSSTN